jgi:hypothetical protein
MFKILYIKRRLNRAAAVALDVKTKFWLLAGTELQLSSPLSDTLLSYSCLQRPDENSK